jgi:hypothetical protein
MKLIPMMRKQASSPTCTSAAACLRARKQEILALWEERVRHELPAAAHKKHYLLIDSLPQLLDELGESLARKSPQLAAVETVPKIHAIQRAAIGDYNLEQIQAEYTILRQVLLEVLKEAASIGTHEWNILLDFVVQGTVVAAHEFMRQADRKSALSEDRLSLAVESAQMGIFDWDVKSGNHFYGVTS